MKFLRDGDHQAGDIVLFVNKNFFFNYLRDIANASFDHVAMFINETEIIEAVPFGGVRVKNYSEFQNKDHQLVRIKNKSYVPKMVEYCTKQIGRKYDILQAVCVYFFVLFRVKKTLSPIDIGTAFVCTELIGQAANNAGFSFANKVETDRLLPDDIWNSEYVIQL